VQQPRNGIRPDFSPAFPSGACPLEISGPLYKPPRGTPAPTILPSAPPQT
jgi:hypothetical protein